MQFYSNSGTLPLQPIQIPFQAPQESQPAGDQIVVSVPETQTMQPTIEPMSDTVPSEDSTGGTGDTTT